MLLRASLLRSRGIRACSGASARSLPRGEQRAPLQLAPGDTVSSFRVDRVKFIEDYGVTLVEMHHPSGARYVHFDTADTNNTFSVGFNTPVWDNKGAPHILEHTALCGSQRYPIRDPFFHMLRRSLNTFMNAFTAQDFTMYPFSTQNVKDYKNLLAVYSDAVFFPLLRREDFLQEGHRWELHEGSDPAGERLAISGVVYNEMKGALGDSGSRYHHFMHNCLFPHTEYAFNSGGDPLEIPDLSYEELVAFHRACYAPSRAVFVTYGDIPPHVTADHIDEHVFQRTSSSSCSNESPRLGSLRSWDAPKTFTGLYPPDAMSGENFCRSGVHWARSSRPGAYDLTVQAVCSTLLVDGPSSPLYKAVIDSGLARDFGPGTGLDSTSKFLSFGVSTTGHKAGDEARIHEAIIGAVNEAAEKGFPRSRVDAVLHQVEIAKKNVSTRLGLQLCTNAVPTLIHGDDLADVLSITPHLARIEKELHETGDSYLADAVRRNLVENQHRASISMRPSQSVSEEEAAAELARVQAERQHLDDERIAALEEQREMLKAAAEQSHDPDALPCVRVAEDVPLEPPPDVPLEVVAGALHTAADPSAPAPLHRRTLEGHGLVHARWVFEAPEGVSDLCWLWGRLGAGARDYAELSDALELHTGGFGARAIVTANPAQPGTVTELLFASTCCLPEKVAAATEVIADVLGRTAWGDVSRVHTLARERAAELEDMLLMRGSALAGLHAAAAVTPAAAIRERLSGLTAVHDTLRAASSADVAAEYAARARDACGALYERGLLRGAAAVASASHMTDAELLVRDVVDRAAADSGATATGRHAGTRSPSARRADRRTIVPLPSPVGYCAWAVPAPEWGQPEVSAPYELLARVLTHQFLHREIRERGGAYGGGASYSGDGALLFSSYRDPHAKRTISAFRSALEWAATSGNITDQFLEEAKLASFGETDAPVAPAARGDAFLLYGITREFRLRRRGALREATAHDLQRAAADLLSSFDDQGAGTVLAPVHADSPAQELLASGEGWRLWDALRSADE